MKVEPTGVVLMDVCGVQTEKCVARKVAPVTAVWTLPARIQVNVCRPCLEGQVRSGEWQIQGAKVERRVDIAVYSPDKRLVLVVEVKKKPKGKVVSGKWAMQVHRNLLAHSGIPSAPYFLLVVPPDAMFLWKNGNSSNAERAPDFQASAGELLEPYTKRLMPLRGSVDEYYYAELVVSSWLKELIKTELRDEAVPKLLKDSGLYAAIKNGTVVMQVALAA
jgi:hypothetical protein